METTNIFFDGWKLGKGGNYIGCGEFLAESGFVFSFISDLIS